MDNEEKVFRTELTGKRGDFSVSPDGSRILFSTNRLSDGLRLLDLRSGKIEVIPVEHGWTWGMPQWSADGKRVVAISTAVRDNRYIVGEQQVILIDPSNWKHSLITVGQGVRIFPFFSADGKTVYYFKGKKRDEGATLASGFDLYATDITSQREARLTEEGFYQVRLGSVDPTNRELLFIAAGGKTNKGADNYVISFNLATHRLKRLSIEQMRDPVKAALERDGNAIFGFNHLDVDAAGNLYFIAAKLREGGGNYRWFVVKTTPEGQAPAILTELPISMNFDIARGTGEIYVMDKQGDQIVFRRLNVVANH